MSDVKCLASNGRVHNVKTNAPDYVPDAKVGGGGFSCKDLTKQNSKRKHNKGNVRAQAGTTGDTYSGIRNWIVKRRPLVSFLENVPELKQTYMIYEFETSDVQFIEEDLGKEGFTVYHWELDTDALGGCKDLNRLWFLVLDIPKWKCERMGIEQKIREYLNCFQCEQKRSEKTGRKSQGKGSIRQMCL